MKTVKAILVHNYFNPKDDIISVLALFIRILGFTHWNHCEILIEENGEKYVIGAVYPKVRRLTYDKWLSMIKRDFKIMEIQTERTPEQMIETANALVGLNYDMGSLFVYMPFYLIHRIWLGRQNNKASHALFCYELLGFVAGWKDYHKISPRQAVKMLS